MQRTAESSKANLPVHVLFYVLLAGAGSLLTRPAQAQDADVPEVGVVQPPDGAGYQTPRDLTPDDVATQTATSGRNGPNPVQNDVNDRLNSTYAVTDELENKTGIGKGDPETGPVRMARFSYVSGNVTWRRSDADEWSDATVNLPVRQDAQIWVTEGGRAELQFDDGSMLRLGRGALVTLQTLYSDADGEFTEVKLSDGLVWLTLKHGQSIYQVDTPFVSAKVDGPARVRVGAGNDVEVAVKQGEAIVEGNQGKVTVGTGDYLNLRGDNDPYVLTRLPRADGWERWNDERDQALDDAEQRPSRQYLPDNEALVAPNLDDYGTWHADDEYGHVWCPRIPDATWQPYYNGSWTWVDPFGWTWVSAEPWGWAPYHYGTWINRPYGWAWCPGPVTQFWCPAVVSFCEFDGRIAWCPLSPREVRFPSIFELGIHNRNWSRHFSIGGVGVYYPHDDGFAYGRRWQTGFVNRGHITDLANVANAFNGPITNTYLNHSFVPVNARAGGVSVASAAGFGGRGTYQALGRGAEATNIFEHGHPIGAPATGQRPFAGPIGARPTTVSMTPTRILEPNVHPAGTALARPVFRAPLQPSIARVGSPVAITSNRSNPVGTALPGRGTSGAFPGRATGDTFSLRTGTRVPAYGNSDPTAGRWSPAETARRAREGLNLPSNNAGPTADRAQGRGGYYNNGPLQRSGGAPVTTTPNPSRVPDRSLSVPDFVRRARQDANNAPPAESPARSTTRNSYPVYNPPVRNTPTYTVPNYGVPAPSRSYGYGTNGYGNGGYGNGGYGRGGYGNGGNGYSAPRQWQNSPAPSAPVTRAAPPVVTRSAPAPAPTRTQPTPSYNNNSSDPSNGRRR